MMKASNNTEGTFLRSYWCDASGVHLSPHPACLGSGSCPGWGGEFSTGCVRIGCSCREEEKEGRWICLPFGKRKQCVNVEDGYVQLGRSTFKTETNGVEIICLNSVSYRS